MTTKQTGLVGFICEITDQPISFNDCLDCAIKGAPGCSLVPAVVQAAIKSLRDPDYSDKLAFQAGADVGFSVTEILGCPRQTLLKAQNEYYEKPTALYRMNRGTGYHAMLSAATESGFISEETLKWRFTYRGKSVLLVGTPDLIEWTPKGWYITDYKVTGKAPFGRKAMRCPHCANDLIKDGAKDYYCQSCKVQVKNRHAERVYIPAQARSSNVMQVNLYALLIEKNLAELQKRIPYANAKFAGGQIVYLPDDKPVRCEVGLDRDSAMAFLKKRLADLLSDDLPGIIDEVEDLWRCDYCPVRSICESHHGGSIGKAGLLAAAAMEAEEQSEPEGV
jgi:hypothetical protein